MHIISMSMRPSNGENKAWPTSPSIIIQVGHDMPVHLKFAWLMMCFGCVIKNTQKQANFLPPHSFAKCCWLKVSPEVTYVLKSQQVEHKAHCSRKRHRGWWEVYMFDQSVWGRQTKLTKDSRTSTDTNTRTHTKRKQARRLLHTHQTLIPLIFKDSTCGSHHKVFVDKMLFPWNFGVKCGLQCNYIWPTR